MRFFEGRIRKKYICQAVFHANLLVSPYFLSILRDKTFDREKDYSVPYIEKFSLKVQTEALTRQDNFICVPFL